MSCETPIISQILDCFYSIVLILIFRCVTVKTSNFYMFLRLVINSLNRDSPACIVQLFLSALGIYFEFCLVQRIVSVLLAAVKRGRFYFFRVLCFTLTLTMVSNYLLDQINSNYFVYPFLTWQSCNLTFVTNTFKVPDLENVFKQIEHWGRAFNLLLAPVVT